MRAGVGRSRSNAGSRRAELEIRTRCRVTPGGPHACIETASRFVMSTCKWSEGEGAPRGRAHTAPARGHLPPLLSSCKNSRILSCCRPVLLTLPCRRQPPRPRGPNHPSAKLTFGSFARAAPRTFEVEKSWMSGPGQAAEPGQNRRGGFRQWNACETNDHGTRAASASRHESIELELSLFFYLHPLVRLRRRAGSGRASRAAR